MNVWALRIAHGYFPNYYACPIFNYLFELSSNIITVIIIIFTVVNLVDTIVVYVFTIVNALKFQNPGRSCNWPNLVLQILNGWAMGSIFRKSCFGFRLLLFWIKDNWAYKAILGLFWIFIRFDVLLHCIQPLSYTNTVPELLQLKVRDAKNRQLI